MFHAGQPVHLISSRNWMAQVDVQHAVVRSVGDEFMVLEHPGSQLTIGFHFKPRQQQHEHMYVLTGLCDLQAECIAEALCDSFHLAAMERCERSIAGYCKHGASDDSYVVVMRKQLEEIKADQAKVHWR